MVTIRKTNTWTFSLTLVVGVLAATLFGGFYGNRLFGSPVQSDVQKRLKEYTDLLAAVTSYAPDDIAADKFVYSSIDGMLRTLDPHTSFLEPKEYADMQDRQKGSFYGRHPGDEAQRPGHGHHPARRDTGRAPRHPGRRCHLRGRGRRHRRALA